MPWNQPGSDGPDENDPWGKSRGTRGGSRSSGPPDLDEIFRQVKARVESLFGGARRGGDGGGPSSKMVSGGMIGLGVLVVLGGWLFSGIYTVDQGEQAVELRFGQYQETKDAGLHWHIPAPFEKVVIINTQQVNTVEVGYRKGSGSLTTVPREALMLTQDENIIDIQFAVQYDIKSPTDLLFEVSEFTGRDIAESVVRQATESAVREIVGRNTMDFAITEGRAQLAAETKTLVQGILDRYSTGINIRAVEMQNAQPPAQVKAAFDDVVKAREDEERIKNLAQAYANDIIPRARGLAARILQEAEAYKAATVAKAEGDADRFTQVLTEYAKAPQITRDRLYLESMEQVLTRSTKLLIDQQQGDSVMYLPLDQLLRGRTDSEAAQGGNAVPDFGGAGAHSTANSGVTTRSANRTGRN